MLTVRLGLALRKAPGKHAKEMGQMLGRARLGPAGLDSWILTAALCAVHILAAGMSYAQWVEVCHLGSFLCHSEFPVDEVPGLREVFPRTEAELTQTLGIQPQGATVEVYLFSVERNYRQFLARHFPDVPYRRALYIRRDGRNVLLAYRSPQLLVDLRHECVHALLHAWLPYVPLWLDEGLAEYFEQQPGRRAFEHPHLKLVRLQAFLGRNPSLERLEALTDMAALGEREYRASWAWVHYLIHGPAEVNDEFRAYLQEIQAGNLPGPLAPRLRAKVNDLDKSFRAHFRSWHP
ncbi:MAG: DUF1570 domain-containing protein [Thermoguttaceae bacterium]|nr:DUF1570 domain-containing protein [Thermoguttaceae bacterium]MDW8077844.1 hypothetical protein [Thermoguttaceae bacterium]